MKMTQVLAIMVMVATLAMTSTAEAKQSKRIVTPALRPPFDGHLSCYIVNASETKTAEINLTIHGVSGPGAEFSNLIIPPSGLATRFSTDDDARFCVVEMVAGKTTDVRVSLVSRSADNQDLAAVQGY